MLQVLFLLLTVVAVYEANDTCSETRVTNIALNVVSRRNSTGHWTVSINYINNIQKGNWSRKSPREISLDVEQSTSSCQDLDIHELAIITKTDRTPPENYEFINGLGFYRIHTDVLSWEDARAQCEEEDAHLLVINSEAETTVVKEYFARGLIAEGATNAHALHTGIHDRYEEGKFVAVTGETLDTVGYKKLVSNEPNGGRGENCLAINTNSHYFDVSCTKWKLPFICEQ